MEIVLLVAVALFLNIAGALLSKYIALNLHFLGLVIVFLALLAVVYVLRVFFWTMAGRRWQLSFIYPVLSINYFLSFLLGILIFKEIFDIKRLVASLVIVVGVLIVSWSPNRRENPGL